MGAGTIRLAVAAVVLGGLAGLLVWQLALKDDSDERDLAAESAEQLESLRQVAGLSGQPVYWVGEVLDARYDLIEIDDKVYVRYAEPGSVARPPTGDELSVATYPAENAVSVLRSESRKPGSELWEAPKGAVVVTRESRPQSAYLAFPGDDDYQVEVYHPEPGEALRLALDGEVERLR